MAEASERTVRKRIKELQTVYPDQVTVTAERMMEGQPGKKYTITFDSERGKHECESTTH